MLRWLTAAGALSLLLTIALIGPSTSGAAPPTGAPSIMKLIPTEGHVNEATVVRIKGKNLSANGLSCGEPEPIGPCETSVSFGANPARVISASPKEDIVLSPTVATTGTVNVVVTVSGVASNSLPFTFIP
jgi:hypothetical protein